MKSIDTTLLTIVVGDKILLSEKKRGFGVGLLNGVGGKLESGETVEEAMIRETQEEIGVTPTSYHKVGLITFDEIVKGEREKNNMHIYLCDSYSGTPTESDEMKPAWFSINDIPYEKMFADDRLWLPEVLKGNTVLGEFVYDEKFNILSHKLKINNQKGEEYDRV